MQPNNAPDKLIYKNVNAADLSLLDKDLENCTFLNCDFSYADLSRVRFIDCVLDNCNLSLAKLANTGMQNVIFNNCKITGLNFSECTNFPFSVSFKKCTMDYTIWHKKKMKGTCFLDCALIEADFSETDLTDAIFRNCDLARTIFNRSLLKGVDFTTAYNFDIDPENNTLTKAKFSANTLSGLLGKYKLVIE